jgi:hypothetical protein
MFPVIHTHDCNYLTIHDSSESKLLEKIQSYNVDVYFTKRFSRNINPYSHDNFISYEVNFGENTVARDAFFKHIKSQYFIKLISPLRDPVSRSISLALHSLDSNFMKETFPNVDQSLDPVSFAMAIPEDSINTSLIKHIMDPIRTVLTNTGIFDIEDIKTFYSILFVKSLTEDYTQHFNVLKNVFDIYNTSTNMVLLKKENIHYLSFQYDDICLKNTSALMRMLDLPLDTELPWERNKYERKEYIFDHNLTVDEVYKELEKIAITLL